MDDADRRAAELVDGFPGLTVMQHDVLLHRVGQLVRAGRAELLAAARAVQANIHRDECGGSYCCADCQTLSRAIRHAATDLAAAGPHGVE